MLPLLVLANIGLAGALAWLWLAPDGQWKGIRWTPPAAVRPALGSGPALPELGVEASRYVATLERPLFAPTRRPPPPPQAASAAPVVVADPAPDLRVLGLYGVSGPVAEGASAGSSGMIARVDGQVKRVRVGQIVSGGWMLKELRAREVVLSRGNEEQIYALRRASVDEPPSADNAASGAQTGARPSGTATILQREIEQARERVRRQNTLRARLGMPPLPEP